METTSYLRSFDESGGKSCLLLILDKTEIKLYPLLCTS